MTNEIHSSIKSFLSLKKLEEKVSFISNLSEQTLDFICLFAIFENESSSLFGIQKLAQKYHLNQNQIPLNLPDSVLVSFLVHFSHILKDHKDAIKMIPNISVIIKKMKSKPILESILLIAQESPDSSIIYDYISLVLPRDFPLFLDFIFSYNNKNLLLPLVNPLLRTNSKEVSNKIINLYQQHSNFEPFLEKMLLSPFCQEIPIHQFISLILNIYSLPYESHSSLYFALYVYLSRNVINIPLKSTNSQDPKQIIQLVYSKLFNGIKQLDLYSNDKGKTLQQNNIPNNSKEKNVKGELPQSSSKSNQTPRLSQNSEKNNNKNIKSPIKDNNNKQNISNKNMNKQNNSKQKNPNNNQNGNITDQKVNNNSQNNPEQNGKKANAINNNINRRRNESPHPIKENDKIKKPSNKKRLINQNNNNPNQNNDKSNQDFNNTNQDFNNPNQDFNNPNQDFNNPNQDFNNSNQNTNKNVKKQGKKIKISNQQSNETNNQNTETPQNKLSKEINSDNNEMLSPEILSENDSDSVNLMIPHLEERKPRMHSHINEPEVSAHGFKIPVPEDDVYYSSYNYDSY